MKKGVKVKYLDKDKYVEGVVKEIQEAKGFRGSYRYHKVFVTVADGSVKEFRDFDLIFMEEDKNEKAEKKLDKKK